MKIKFLLACSITLLCGEVCRAQYSVRSADGNSSIWAMGEEFRVSYLFDENRLGLSYQLGDFTSVNINGIQYTIHELGLGFDAGATLSEKAHSVFSGGEFDPGYDFTTTAFVNLPGNPLGADFAVAYLRNRLGFTDLPYALVDEGNKITKVDTFSFASHWGAGFSVGLNFDMIIGLSFQFGNASASTFGLKKKTLVEQSVIDTSSKSAITSSSERYTGLLRERASSELRIDYSWNMVTLGSSKAPTLGIVAAVSTKMVEDIENPSYNAGIGLALFRAGYPNQIQVAAVANFTDLNSAFKADQTFDDIFGVKLYVGHPF